LTKESSILLKIEVTLPELFCISINEPCANKLLLAESTDRLKQNKVTKKFFINNYWVVTVLRKSKKKLLLQLLKKCTDVENAAI
jgi:hypothetical protein